MKVWLNNMSNQGYRLIGVNLFMYEFVKSDKQYFYGTQFIGNNSYQENLDYLRLLHESDKKVFRAPINLGNLAIGKFRLRPL
ncbi:DUF2812 domain-containing protein [Aerococcaceae bacterium zg-1292]|uniref:DUF2812 domain-containing protein n=1 Tax=Aerococcaceae bacterium zg-1292 TaxID=2774330 RepID=UPI00385C590D